jgi:hypothetical protein
MFLNFRLTISLFAYIDTTVGKCPLCDYEEGEQFSDEEKENID